MPNGVVSDLGFVGRAQELAAISARAADAAAGRPSVVWIDGAAGAGKTALLRAAVAALPSGFAILRAEASELASDLPFDLVGQLGEVTARSPFPVALELLRLWGAANRGGPVAVTVEDLHWADAESRLALLAAVRRLREDPVLVLVTSRAGPEDADGWDRLRADPDRCLHVTLGPLSQTEVAELAARGGVALTSAAAARLTRHAGGHPLYVRTLLTELPAAALTAGDGELPAPRSLASATLARLAELPADARRLATALAVLNQPASLQLLGQVVDRDGVARSADDLLATGFVTWRPGGPAVLEFAHPLYRAAVYADLPPSLRQELHRRAAAVTGGTVAFGHRVAASDSFDDELAAELEAAAAAQTAQHHLGQAASYLLWASELSSDRAQAEPRLLRAARLRLAAGRSVAVESLRARIEACGPRPLRSLVLGTLAWEHGDAAGAERWLREAADGQNPASADSDADGFVGEVAVDALAQLALMFATQLRPGEAADAAARALAAPAPAAGGEERAWTAVGFAEAMAHGAPEAVERIRLRLPQPAYDVGAADLDLLIARGSLQLYAGRSHAALADLRAAVRLARHEGSLYLSRAHVHLCQALLRTGDWDEALVHGRVAVSLVSDERNVWLAGQAHAVLAEVLSARGDWGGATEQLSAAERGAEEAGTAEARTFSQIARGSLAAARGEQQEVIAALTPLAEIYRHGFARIGLLTWWPTLITALIGAGTLDAAEWHIDVLSAVAADRGLAALLAARVRGLRARLDAASGRTAEAAAGYGQAADMLGRDDPLLEVALLYQDYGLFLAGHGDPAAGTGRLSRARKMLAAARAVPYLERLDAAAASAGIGMPAPSGVAAVPLPRAAAAAVTAALTDREADVVALIAKRMSNAEVAAELYVSVNTVEFHLRNIYTKLGIRSRRELRALVGGVGAVG